MKSIYAILCILALILITSSATLAAEDNWAITLRGDDGVGWPGSSRMGVHPLASDGEDDYDQGWVPAMEVDVVVLQTIPASSGLWSTVANSPSLPNVWDLRVASLGITGIGTHIQLDFITVGSTVLPPELVGGVPVRYRLEMVDNRGVPGAPANGSVWDVPIPTSHVGGFYTVPDLLPMLQVSSPTAAAILSEAYVLEFRQEAIPEPSSLLALGVGLGTLVGLARRRRMA